MVRRLAADPVVNTRRKANGGPLGSPFALVPKPLVLPLLAMKFTQGVAIADPLRRAHDRLLESAQCAGRRIEFGAIVSALSYAPRRNRPTASH